MYNNLPDLSSITSYNFYNTDWYIAADIVKQYNLSTNYNTYYSKYFSNGRLYGPTTSYEFRLSGSYLEEFKRLYGANNSSLNKSNNAVWLIDRETVYKLLNNNTITNKDKTNKNVITVESNAVSIDLHLKPTKQLLEGTGIKVSEVHSHIINLPVSGSINPNNIGNNRYSEEEISDAIVLLSSKLTNTPYQQEKILDGGSIRLDLFTATRRNVYAIELKKDVITLSMIKEKIEDRHYLSTLISEYPNLPITFIFSSPKGITFEGLLYLQEISSSIKDHRVIYKPTSNIILDMINKREKELPTYYYKQMLDKPIIKYLLQAV